MLSNFLALGSRWEDMNFKGEYAKSEEWGGATHPETRGSLFAFQ